MVDRWILNGRLNVERESFPVSKGGIVFDEFVLLMIVVCII